LLARFVCVAWSSIVVLLWFVLVLVLVLVLAHDVDEKMFDYYAISNMFVLCC
jgi:hypothetical protein